MESRREAEMTRLLDALFGAGVFDGRDVFLFGHCDAAEEAADCLLRRGVTPAAILDNSESKQGLAYRGVPISPPGRIRGRTPENSVVIIAARFFAEMSAQLRRLGYGGEIIRAAGHDSFAEYSLSDETLERKTARARRGAETLRRVRRRYPSRRLVVCPNDALGDVYWAMAFLPAYREKNHVGEVVVAVTGDACRQVAEMFGAGEVIALDGAEMDELVQAIIFTREGDCVIAHHDRPYTDNIAKWLDKHFLSFIDFYRRAVYGLASDATHVPPRGFAPFENQERIPKGGAVILSPHAKSVVRPPAGFWTGIAAEYSKKGFVVYTNVVPGERPVEGTSPLSLPVSRMIAAAEHAGFFVGVRNGLCDVLHSAKCRKTVVFPDCFYSSTPHKVADFFALPGWERIIVAPER
jgi:hypothetical protein